MRTITDRSVPAWREEAMSDTKRRLERQWAQRRTSTPKTRRISSDHR